MSVKFMFLIKDVLSHECLHKLLIGTGLDGYWKKHDRQLQSSLMYVVDDNTANYFVLQFDFALISWVDTNGTIISFIHELRTERSDWRDSVLYCKRVKALGCWSVLTRDWADHNLFH